MYEERFQKLRAYCEAENFMGWDPYDGLNSRLFQATCLSRWDVARLVLIQLCKRSPVNLRNALRVPKQHNAKGIALFLNGYCNLYRLGVQNGHSLSDSDEILKYIQRLADQLVEMSANDFSGACWGYNFPWQSRRSFYFPANTPTVVATSFCVQALFEASKILSDRKYAEIALSSGEFVISDLNWVEIDDGAMVSYSPITGNDTVINASLLGAKLLSYCYRYSGDERYKTAAHDLVKGAISLQESDGSWVYGLLPTQGWKDSFHTGYNLEALAFYGKWCEDKTVARYLDLGLNFYLENYFCADGTPKYYHDQMYPIDIHCPGQLWVTLSATNATENNMALALNVADWTLNHLQDPTGFFYYQRKKYISSKISYMRWSNAFMFNAMTYLLLDLHSISNDRY